MTKEAKVYTAEKTISSISGAGKAGELLEKNKIRALPNTIHKTKKELKT